MPDMGGIELIAELRRQDASVPVLVMTGHAGQEEAEKALRSGAATVLHKPLDFRMLREAIEACGVRQEP